MRKKSRYFRIFFRLTQRSRIAIQQNKTLFIHVSSWRGKIKKKKDEKEKKRRMLNDGEN